ncbi:hypothetical protein JW851_03220 [Candidatus Woesearchaeota archaeon]|nr:hypothetical protein [Candidatus Woesearchaeota archaeon]
MVDSTLKNYVKTTLKQGYAISAIRTRLIQSGYSKQEINTAIKEATGRKIISTKALLIAAVVIVVLILVVIISLKVITPSAKQIYISTTPLVSTVIPGGKLTFVNTLTSSTSKTVEAELKHQIIYKKTGKTIGTKTEKVSVSKKSSTQTQITLPSETLSGEYETITTLTHKQGSKQASFNFIVEQKTSLPTPSVEEPSAEVSLLCPTGCDDYNACTIDNCVSGICEHIEIIPCCGNGICEAGEDAYSCSLDCGTQTETSTETINQAIKKARTDPQTATMLCNSLPSVTDADDCFNTLAEKTSKYEFCESIQEDELQSSCLLNFALAGNYDVCDKIDDPYYLQSCYSLERQASLQGIAVQFS